jgi:hypothetical protein
MNCDFELRCAALRSRDIHVIPFMVNTKICRQSLKNFHLKTMTTKSITFWSVAPCDVRTALLQLLRCRGSPAWKEQQQGERRDARILNKVYVFTMAITQTHSVSSQYQCPLCVKEYVQTLTWVQTHPRERKLHPPIPTNSPSKKQISSFTLPP